LIRYRFREDQIAALLRIRWWEWPDAMIREHVGDVCSDDIAGFIERYDAH
jgi:hypothetical protein